MTTLTSAAAATNSSTSAAQALHRQLENRYTLDQFIDHLKDHYDCTASPLIEIPTPLHVLERIVNKTPDAIGLYWPNIQNQSYDKYTYHQVWDLSGRLLDHLKETFLVNINSRSIIAVLCDDNPGLFFLLLALFRGDYIPLLLSTRNSQEAIKSMVEEAAECKVIITSNLTLTTKLRDTNNVVRICEYQQITPEVLSDLPPQQIVLSQSTDATKRNGQEALETICAILHSSGTTRFPTLIKVSHRYMYTNGIIVHRWQKYDSFLSLNIGPLFHAMTFSASFASFLCGCTPACFPLSTKTVPKPSELMQSIRLLKPTKVNLVPVMLQLLCDHADMDTTGADWQVLRNVKCIAFGGAPLPASLAKRLKEHHINVLSNYGSTEAGCVLGGYGRSDRDNFAAMTIMPEVSYKFIPSIMVPGAYELYIAHDCITVASLNITEPYATKDCFLPGESGTWYYHSRLNDVLIHSNGEKTNALQLELDIQDHSRIISRVAVCGSGKPHTTAIIEVDWERAAQTYLTVNEIMTDLQTAVRLANTEAPSHSRIPAHSIHCLHPGLSLPLTAKGSLARSKAEIEFANLLEDKSKPRECHDGFNETGLAQDKTKMSDERWSEDSFSKAIADELSQQLGISCEEILSNAEIPFMEYGITSQILAQMQSIVEDLLGHKISPTLPYEYPTLKEFTRACLTILDEPISGETTTTRLTVDRILNKYQSLIDDWKSTLRLLSPIDTANRGGTAYSGGTACRGGGDKSSVYMIIGASGGLGNELVYYLSHSNRVMKVICLLRGLDPLSRLRDAMKERHLEIDWNKLEVYNYKMEDDMMGLSISDYHRLREEVTDVIHNAWRLNFNISIDQYDKDCLPGLMNTIKFCTGSFNRRMKSLTFISSISAIGRYAKDDTDKIPEISVTDPHWVLPFGYAQSKYIAEYMVEYSAKTLKNFPTNIIRCGQLSGDRHRGLWNIKDFMALLIRGGAQQLGMMPSSRYPADIVPMDVAAEAVRDIVEATDSSSSTTNFYHIANPHGGDWDNFLALLKRNGMNFNTVDHADFYEEVRKRPDNACYVLLAWLHGDTQKSSRIRGHLDCTSTLQVSPSFLNCPPVDENLIRLYLDQWKNCGFLEA